jgi:hypothetical protein
MFGGEYASSMSDDSHLFSPTPSAMASDSPMTTPTFGSGGAASRVGHLHTKLASTPSPARGMDARLKSDAKTEAWLHNKARLTEERRLKTEAAAHRRLSAKGRAESKEHVRRERLERQQTAAAQRRHLSKQETVKFGELRTHSHFVTLPCYKHLNQFLFREFQPTYWASSHRVSLTSAHAHTVLTPPTGINSGQQQP